jgi:flagellar FliL protein
VRKAPKREAHTPPTYMPLEPFVVNLADRDSDRYAQIGITLEIDDAKFADELKAYMPAVRNSILMILSHKTAADMLGREGKELLAAEIAREAVRPMGINIEVESDAEGTSVRKKPRAAPVYNPVQQVHFSSFIVQ